MFERDGYHDARLADITTLAGISAGSFYTYFDNKEQVLAAVFEAAEEDMLPGASSTTSSDGEVDPVARIEQANRDYFAAYRRHARLMLLMEQVTALEPEFQEMRRRRAQSFTMRNAERTAELQRQGLVDPTLDPVLTARALSGMVSRMAYYAFALDTAGSEALMAADEEHLTRLATRLWVNALGLRRPAPASRC